MKEAMVAPVRILVVDDEEQIARLLAGVLRREGHRTDYATSGEAALERLRKAPVDLLVTDLRMPGLDGVGLIEQAKRLHPDVDVLVITAYASAETAVHALRHGVSDYLNKPFGVDDVRGAVRRALDARSERRRRETQVDDLSADLGRRVADLGLLHELTRTIAERAEPLDGCLRLLAGHLDADHVVLRDGSRVVSSFGAPGSGREHARAPVGAGAVDVARRAPFSADDLRLLAIAGRDLALAVENERLVEERRRAYLGIVTTLIEAVEAKDRFNRGHSTRVADLALRFAQRLGLPAAEVERIEVAGKLHDIGKIGVPEEILNKPGRLSDDEFDAIKEHPVIGEQILRPLDFLAEVRPIVRHHHERWDGRGYPDGLAGDEIPRAAALLAIVDAYDAMTSNRPYRDGLSPREARSILERGAGEQWDPDLVARFDPV